MYTMRSFVLTSLVLSNLFVHVYCLTCEQYQSRIDNLHSLDKLVTYLSVGLHRQKDVGELYTCLGQNNATQRLPTDLIKNFTDPNLNTRNFIYGNGYSTRYVTKLIPFWNRIQRFAIRRLWIGIILKIDTITNNVTLLNVIESSNSMLFYAEVYTKTSMIDGLEAVILDYRKENSLRFSKIRDEIREVQYRGIKSGIYFGQAYRYDGPDSDIFTVAWDNVNSFSFSVNFLLHFRETNQDNIPSWALANYV